MLGEESSKIRESFIRVIPLILLSLSVLLFSQDILRIGIFLWGLFLQRFGAQTLTLSADDIHLLLVAGYKVFLGFGVFFLVWLFLISSQALLPVHTFDEKLQTASRLIDFILLGHGPAVFVKDGKLKAEAEELFRYGPGVAIIDFNSALVLERVVGVPGCLYSIIRAVIRFLLTAFLGIQPKKHDAVRVCGPGLTFINAGEKSRE